MTPNFVVVVNVLLPICSYGFDPHIFVEEIVTLLVAMVDKLVWKFFCGQNQKISNDQVKFTPKLEDMKVLRRSPDLLNNVKIGQGHYSL